MGATGLFPWDSCTRLHYALYVAHLLLEYACIWFPVELSRQAPFPLSALRADAAGLENGPSRTGRETPEDAQARL